MPSTIGRFAWLARNAVFDFTESMLELRSPHPIALTAEFPCIRVLFVCYGNVCRSPMAEGIFGRLIAQQGLVGQIYVDSAGIGSHNVGKKPDWRARASLRRRGINISNLRGRQFTSTDFDGFDYIVAMDHENLGSIRQIARNEKQRQRATLLLDYLPDLKTNDIEDPIGKPLKQFEQTCSLIERACHALLEHITSTPQQVRD